jgi:hypothetical protein
MRRHESKFIFLLQIALLRVVHGVVTTTATRHHTHVTAVGRISAPGANAKEFLKKRKRNRTMSGHLKRGMMCFGHRVLHPVAGRQAMGSFLFYPFPRIRSPVLLVSFLLLPLPCFVHTAAGRTDGTKTTHTPFHMKRKNTRVPSGFSVAMIACFLTVVACNDVVRGTNNAQHNNTKEKKRKEKKRKEHNTTQHNTTQHNTTQLNTT